MKTPEVGDWVTWLSDGNMRTAVVLRVEEIQAREGPKRCLSVRIPGDKSARAYRFIDQARVTHVDSK